MPKSAGRLRNLAGVMGTAAERGAMRDLAEYILYRSPIRRGWARLRGHRFHRSSIIWFRDDADAHTRIMLLLPRLKLDYPNLDRVDLEFEFFNSSGKHEASWKLAGVPATEPFVVDSRRLPPEFPIAKPFSGALWVKERLQLDDPTVIARDGLFNATHTYIDYYREGSFVTTLHDYCAFLPDQGLEQKSLGMIPAVCGETAETFLVIHAADGGIGPRDIEALLYNDRGEVKRVPLGALAPFATREVFLTKLFPDAREFLAGRPGQVVLKGIFRRLMSRVAYGIYNAREKSFSLDHCFYSAIPGRPVISSEQRHKIAKGYFNPFAVLEDDRTTTSAVLFHGAAEEPFVIDVLVYDAEGRLVVNASPYAALGGNATQPIPVRALLKEAGVPLPFTGHAEVLHHLRREAEHYPRDLELCVEYNRGGKTATVIFGAMIWNPPHPISNPNYRSGCRVVCDDVHTTFLAISNCSYATDYGLTVPFSLNLVGGGRILDSRRLEIGPNATIYKSIEEIFPDARERLKPFGGLGLTTTTDINASCLTHLFFTQDRKSGAFSVEHSLDV